MRCTGAHCAKHTPMLLGHLIYQRLTHPAPPDRLDIPGEPEDAYETLCQGRMEP